MSHLSAKSNLVNFCSTKNLTSNGSKPIRVLMRTKSSCSDERLPKGYSLPDFQHNWSNFLSITSPFFTTRKKGGRHIGGTPGAGEVPMTLWLILLTSFKVKLNHFTSMDVGKKWKNFLPTSFRENMYRNSQIDVVIWSIRKFFGWFGKTLWSLEKSCRRPSEKS